MCVFDCHRCNADWIRLSEPWLKIPIECVNDLCETVHFALQVETIGDAYMVVGGVPEISEHHAEKVANFAMDMIKKSQEVCSPATNKPLQVTTVFMYVAMKMVGCVHLPKYINVEVNYHEWACL